MSITTEVAKNIYTCNGVTTVFPYTFRIIDEAHIEVIHITETGVETVLVIDTEYTVSGVGSSSGNVTTIATYADGTLVLRRKVPLKQLTEFDNQGGYYPKTNEDAVDYDMMVAQMLKEFQDRAIVQSADKIAPLTMPAPEVGKVLISVSATELGWADPATPYPPKGNINFTLDGGGYAIPTGIVLDIVIPFNLTLTGMDLLADQTGSIVLDLWKDTYANYPPTIADTIVASAKPTISSGVKSKDITLTGWTVDLDEGDVIRVNVDSVTSITRLAAALAFTRR